MNRLTFFLYSSILNKNVYDEFDDVMGVLKDVYVTTTDGYPKVIGYKVKKDLGIIDYEFREINFYQRESGKVKIKISGSKEILARNYSYLLTKDILDKKIVDINGRQVVRVEDLRIAEVSDEYRLIAVETGKFVRYRRKGYEWLGNLLAKIFPKDFKEKAIMWENVESLEFAKNNIQVSVPYQKIQELHPADIADILEELDHKDRKSIFESLNDDLAADILEEIEPEVQESIIRELSDTKTAELFENIPNDEIADILDDLSESQRERILLNIERDDAKEVKELLSYDEESIGSIMNKDFIALNYLDITVEEVIELLRESKPEEEVMYTIYITDDEGKLTGSVNVAQLILSDKHLKLRDIMEDKPISINYTNNLDVAAEMVAKYGIASMPVVDDDDKLVGIVLMHDVVDEVFAPGWKRRFK